MGTKYFRTNEVKILRYEILIHNPKCTWEWSVTVALAQLVYKGNYYSIKCKQFYLVVMCLAGLIECWVLQLVFLQLLNPRPGYDDSPKCKPITFSQKIIWQQLQQLQNYYIIWRVGGIILYVDWSRFGFWSYLVDKFMFVLEIRIRGLTNKLKNESFIYKL